MFPDDERPLAGYHRPGGVFIRWENEMFHLKRSGVPMVLLLSLFFLSIFVPGCNRGGTEGDDNAGTESEETKVDPVPVESIEIERGSISSFILSSSTVKPVQQVVVFPRTSGVVESVFVDEGDDVDKEMVLTVLDDRELALQLQRSAEVASQKETLLQRTLKLFEKGLVSESEWEKIKFEASLAKTDLAAAELAWEGTRINSPISGMVSEKMVEPGERVDPAKSLFRIEDLSTLHVELDLPEKDLAGIREGQSAIISTGYDETISFEGAVEKISPAINPATGTGKIRIKIFGGGNPIKTGSFVRVKIVTETREDVLLVPKKAILRQDDQMAVFVVADTIAVKEFFSPGLEDDRWVEALEGVEENERVVVVGQEGLKDSTLVFEAE